MAKKKIKRPCRKCGGGGKIDGKKCRNCNGKGEEIPCHICIGEEIPGYIKKGVGTPYPYLVPCTGYHPEMETLFDQAEDLEEEI